MSASAARIAANKANAQKSTGPRTPEGKARVSENALKHGLRSERNTLDLASDVALPIEREEFLATLAAFTQDLQPLGPLETRLVERLAQIDLRLNRAVRMETAHLEMHTGLLTQSMGSALPIGEGAGQTRQNWLTTLAFLKSPSATTLIGQYESRLSRDFARTLSQLRQAQKLRAQQPTQNLGNQTQASVPLDPQKGAASDRSVGYRETEKTSEPAPSCPIPEMTVQTQLTAQVIEITEDSTAAAS